jgi:hypothetical protein
MLDFVVFKTLEQDAGIQLFTDSWSAHATVQSPFRSCCKRDEQIKPFGAGSSASNLALNLAVRTETTLNWIYFRNRWRWRKRGRGR